MSHWDDAAAAGIADARAACWGEGWGDYGKAKIQPTLPDSGHVLDLGCGVGRLAIPIARQHPRLTVIGADSCPGMLAHAAVEAKGTHVLWVDADEYFRQSSPRLAGAYSMLMFQHVEGYEAMALVDDVGSCLERGARFTFQVADSDHETELSQGHSEETAIGWCEFAGLEVESLSRDDYCPTWRWITARKP